MIFPHSSLTDLVLAGRGVRVVYMVFCNCCVYLLSFDLAALLWFTNVFVCRVCFIVVLHQLRLLGLAATVFIVAPALECVGVSF